MLNNQQIKLVQTAIRAAGIRDPKDDRRYRLLLGQYKRSNGSPVTSCKQLNNSQLDDLLALCESMGWRMPGKPDNHYRFKISTEETVASFAQQEAIKYLAGDFGWNIGQLGGMLKRMTGGFATSVSGLTPAHAYNVIEALKAMLSRERGTRYTTLKQIKDDMEVTNAEEKASQG